MPDLIPSQKIVVVGLSGGVDSAVTAKLLQEEGYKVIGVFMKNWDDRDDPYCPAAIDAASARNVAQAIKIPFYAINFVAEYRQKVFRKFLQSHRQLRTPNPDVWCNQYIKFGFFQDFATKLGSSLIATGHYARRFYDKETKKYQLHTPQDAHKDQTYFLHAINQKQLSASLFPLADLTKNKVRALAHHYRLPNADRRDSTGICFVGERDYLSFLRQHLPTKTGDIITDTGRVVGTHLGLHFYTLGQRKNLGIGGVATAPDAPWFVWKKLPSTNQLVIAQDEKKLLTSIACLKKCHWIAGRAPQNIRQGLSCLVKVRYLQEFQKAILCRAANSPNLQVEFAKQQRAITPGQFVVFYDPSGLVCWGGGEAI